MDLRTGYFNQPWLQSIFSCEGQTEAAGAAGPPSRGSGPNGFCPFLAASAPTSWTGTFAPSRPSNVCCLFNSVTLILVKVSHVRTGLDVSMSVMPCRFEQAGSEVLNYLLEFVNWSTLPPTLRNILARRQEEGTWEPRPHLGLVTRHTEPAGFIYKLWWPYS